MTLRRSFKKIAVHFCPKEVILIKSIIRKHNMKVLVGCPTYEGYAYCLDDYIKRVKEFVYNDFDLVLVDNSKSDTFVKKLRAKGIHVLKAEHAKDVRERIAVSRNMLRDHVLQNNYEYFLSLEQDVIPPKDVLPRLLRHQKKIVSGIYFKLYSMVIPVHKKEEVVLKKKKMLTPLIFKFSNEPSKMRVCTYKDVEGDKFFKIRACGLGCVLIHRDVLEKIKFRKEESSESYDDFIFCTDAYEHGFEIYADTSVKCKHLILKKGDVYK